MQILRPMKSSLFTPPHLDHAVEFRRLRESIFTAVISHLLNIVQEHKQEPLREQRKRSKRKAEIGRRLPFRLALNEEQAAVALSLSPSRFRELVAEGLLPSPRVIGSRLLY